MTKKYNIGDLFLIENHSFMQIVGLTFDASLAIEAKSYEFRRILLSPIYNRSKSVSYSYIYTNNMLQNGCMVYLGNYSILPHRNALNKLPNSLKILYL